METREPITLKRFIGPVVFVLLGAYFYSRHGLAFASVVSWTVAVIWVLTIFVTDHLYVFGWGLPIICAAFGFLHQLKHGAGLGSYSAFAFGLTVLLATIFSRETLGLIYKYWMKMAHAIGATVTFLILVIMFFVIFAPLGILFRIMKKDFLDRQWDPRASSYWRIRERVTFDRSRCTKQF